MMRILGIDPGLRFMGWGLIDCEGSSINYAGSGYCTSRDGDLSGRLLRLFEQLQVVVHEYAPHCAAVENSLIHKGATSALKLGHARAVALLVPRLAGLEVAEYAPNKVKLAVVGNGHADKLQVARLVRMYLPGAVTERTDASDALAIALTHAFHLQYSDKLAAALSRAGA